MSETKLGKNMLKKTRERVIRNLNELTNKKSYKHIIFVLKLVL